VTTRKDELIVYTCITGGYDDLQPVMQPEPGVAYVCFSDRALPGDRGWEVRPLPYPISDAVLANRFVKMHPHLLFPQHARSVYVDGNITPKPGVRELAQEALGKNDFALYNHPFRDCAYAEAATCAVIGHDWAWAFTPQLRRYRDEGLPARVGLYECSILFRNHHAPAVVSLMHAWWDEFNRGVRRDQVSLPYLLWKMGLPARDLGQSHIRSGNPNFGLRASHNAPTFRRDLRHYINLLVLRCTPLPTGKPADPLGVRANPQ
jgi:hypothetical protein